ncbi:RagB/SusD family nutrient uptake outer membrane protein [Bacteroides sp. 214]|uniref:RagB/SusD family nutrient uptake outer membrane protein n=1 Tax=Bacteroides sp. 214 TaxID=2302935 RepID=UPI0013D2DEA0|nr:RagB/SusD family nutrient uptake outer membrane protein [Bacteroides sp. 214]
MKKNILIIGLALLGLTSCSDYLDVDSPSKFSDDYVVSSIVQADRLLNSVYAKLASKNTYGNGFFTTFLLNSDVEFTTSTAEVQSPSRNEYKLFDCEADAGSLLSMWNSMYATIESANNFVGAAEKSELFAARDSSMLQMVGEAKCIRAMNYLDMVIMFGDVPFSLIRSYDAEDMVMPMAKRDVILTTLIDDLIATAPMMQFSANLTEGVERCSREFCWSLIARIALFRGGYSLHPGASKTDVGTMQRASDYLDYYKIAREYSEKVIKSGTHALNKGYFEVFIDECNYKVASGDDPIFEIPFTQNVSGNVGYAHGPSGSDSSAGGTEGVNKWGKSGGGTRLNSFYRFTFDEQDARRETVGFWSYSYNGTPSIQNTYNNFCNKWSKFWDENATLGYQSGENTGINFPYMRYADVLLMFAEAENELNGPTDDAKNALKEVRERAFRNATNKADMVDAYVNVGTKDEFFQLIFDERKWEFGGENIRWKDLVRWNLYNQVIYKTFWNYYGIASDDYSSDVDELFDTYPRQIYYREVSNPGDGSYPNKVMDVLEFFTDPEYGVDCKWKNFTVEYLQLDPSRLPPITGSNAWKFATWMDWQSDGYPKAECRCSLRGYIYADDQGQIIPSTMPNYSASTDLSALPPVRYILPIPSDAISRSKGAYTNYYGY